MLDNKLNGNNAVVSRAVKDNFDNLYSELMDFVTSMNDGDPNISMGELGNKLNSDIQGALSLQLAPTPVVDGPRVLPEGVRGVLTFTNYDPEYTYVVTGDDNLEITQKMLNDKLVLYVTPNEITEVEKMAIINVQVSGNNKMPLSININILIIKVIDIEDDLVLSLGLSDVNNEVSVRGI